MGRIIHARETPEGWRYRDWSTIVDRYCTRPATEAEIREYLKSSYTGLEIESGVWIEHLSKRLDRARATGSSSMNADPLDTKGPWDTERCNGCGSFHHAFKPRDSDGKCSWCGELESTYVGFPEDTHKAHNPPCSE